MTAIIVIAAILGAWIAVALVRLWLVLMWPEHVVYDPDRDEPVYERSQRP